MTTPGTVAGVSTDQVIDVELRRGDSLTVEYEDRVTASFPLAALREGCPCAGCRGRRDTGHAASAGESIDAVDAELHGNWGISIRWNDGHDTGIYSWSLLRRWWDGAIE